MSEHTPAPDWRRSSRCSSGSCVEVARRKNVFLVRDSKDPASPHLNFPADSWREFIDRVKTDGLAPR